MNPITYTARHHVGPQSAGPCEVTCKQCRNLMLPERPGYFMVVELPGEPVTHGSGWDCFVCDRKLLVTWEPTPEAAK